ncbi:MAG TPA: hypothetical protein VGH01_02930 [Jatrophihabitantaceae bacterium]|jgi:hypothetical protein
MSALRIQTVLYRHQPATVDRWLRGVFATVAFAQRAGHGGPTSIVLGDCTPEPVVTAQTQHRWGEQYGAAGIDVAFVHFGANLGHGGAQNALAERAAAGTEYLLVLNPDGMAAVTMLTRLLGAMETGVAATEARQSPFEHPKSYDPRSGDTAWVSGAAALFRFDAFTAAGRFDADTFFLHGDDVDLSWRLRLDGGRLRHVPEAVFVHDKRVDAAGRPRVPHSEQFYGSLGALLLLHKYSRPDAVNHWEHHLSMSGNEVQRAALAEFRRRRVAGTLPQPIDAGHQVSEVIGASFGPSRF